jgi:hypothetical protein
MIALLTGRVEQLTEGSCVLDVNGVGYLVQASTRTLGALSQPPATTRLLIETVVREDAIQLCGFADPAERDWFRLLTTVQGVGAKGRVVGAFGAVAARPGGGHRRRRPGQPGPRSAGEALCAATWHHVRDPSGWVRGESSC